MGLLRKIEESVNRKPYFSTFCKKYGFNHAGIYILQNNNFVLSKCFGLDAETIFKSVSTKDFWEGTLNYKIDNDFWISFSRKEDNLEPFFQFFSKDTVDSLNSIYYFIFKTSSVTGIFFTINDEEEYILPEVNENVEKELLYFANETSTFSGPQLIPDNYTDEKYIPAEINFLELYNFYQEELKYYPENIKTLLINSFYEQFYFNIKSLLSSEIQSIPSSDCKINILIPKTDDFNKIEFTRSLNNNLKQYCSRNLTLAVRLYFYTFDSINKDEFFRSKP